MAQSRGEPRSWRDVEEPKIALKDVLAWIISQPKAVTSRQVADAFKTSQADAGMRLSRLRKFGLVSKEKAKDEGSNHWWYEYAPTDWGKKYATDQHLV